ncbi:MAG: DUF502 domain-containing protein [SAR202 cluster bacterium]|nr:DUF502 domain-containing protein [SAR202 cluster bacterium]
MAEPHRRHHYLRSKVTGHFTRTLGAGLLLLVPVGITYLVLKFLFDAIDGLLQPAIEAFLGRHIPGLGVIIVLLLVYAAGLLSTFFLGRMIIHMSQRLLLRVPIINTVYSSAKQLIESFSGTSDTGFKRVVLIEYPRPGAWTIGFLTSVTKDEDGKTLAIVYIPTAPTPQSGWVAILPMDEVYDTEMPVQMAMRLVLSGGIVSPEYIRKRKTTA